MSLRFTLCTIIVLLTALFYAVKPANASRLSRKNLVNTVREEMEPDPSMPPPEEERDGLLGICSIDVVVPLSACYCNSLLTGALAVTNSRELTVQACVAFFGDEETILNNSASCVPFLTINGTVNAELLVGTLNQLVLTTCKAEPGPVVPIKLAC